MFLFGCLRHMRTDVCVDMHGHVHWRVVRGAHRGALRHVARVEKKTVKKENVRAAAISGGDEVREGRLHTCIVMA